VNVNGRRRKTALVLVALGACFTLTCHEDRTDSAAPVYRTDVQTLLKNRCVQCHGEVSPAGGWRATSYMDAISCVSNNRPATLPTDDTAPILTALNSDAHAKIAQDKPLPDGERALLANWVKLEALAFPPKVHPAGFPDPRSPDFHAKFLRDQQ
jgi:hypothetical protein